MKRRILSIITALALCLSLCPTWAFAVEGEPDTGLCDHHPEHIGCGYAAPTEGHPCGHQHTAECYTLGVLPDADSGNPYEVGGDTENLLDCHHSHDSECGYVEADPGAPCGYECRICPIEDLIAALPEQVTEDNRADVEAQLQEILGLFSDLTEEEQEEINLSRIYALQGALDEANNPMPLAGAVEYVDAAGNAQQSPADCVTITADMANKNLTGGWYVAEGNVTINGALNFDGETHLILADGCKLTVNNNLQTTNLTIYGQTNGTGFLCAGNNSLGAPAIGALSSKVAITINGGCVQAMSFTIVVGTAPYYVIGGLDGSTVTINGGVAAAHDYFGQKRTFPQNCTANSSRGCIVARDGVGEVYGSMTLTGTTGSGITLSSLHIRENASLNSLGGLNPSTCTTDSIGIGELEIVYGSGITRVSTLEEIQKDISAYISISGKRFTINGLDSITVSETEGKDYTYTATCARGTDTRSQEFIPPAMPITDEGIFFSMTGGPFAYTGSQITPGVSLLKGVDRLQPNTDYTVKYENNINVGTGAVTVTGIGRYKGTITRNFTITDKYEYTDATYIDETGTEQTVHAAILSGSNNNVETLDTGWYVLVGTVFRQSVNISSNSDVRLILPDDGSLTLKEYTSETNGYLTLQRNSSLTIYGQAGGSGSLSASIETGICLTINEDASLTVNGGIIGVNAPVQDGLIVSKFAISNRGAFTYNGKSENLTVTGRISSTGTLRTERLTEDMIAVNTENLPKGASKDLSEAVSACVSLTNPIYAGKEFTLTGWMQSVTKKDNCNYTVTYTHKERGTVSKEVELAPCDHPNPMAYNSNNNGTHTKTCLVCGQTWDAEDCTYTFSDATGTCAACKDSVTVAVSDTDGLIYDGTEKKPGVTVTRGETALAAGTDYTVAYSNNKNAGENKATVAVTIGKEQGTYIQNFSIGRATPTITWSSTTQELTYTGDPAAITAPTVTLVNNGQFVGTISYSYQKQGETAYKDGLPTDAGTYTIKAHVDAAGNYTAADSGEMTLTINPSPVTLTFNDQTITYGGTPTGATANPASADIKYSYITGEGGEPISGWPTNAGTYTVTAKVEATGNYGEAIQTATLTINPKEVSNPTIELSPNTFVYDGTEKKPAVTVKDGEKVIPADEYTVDYSNNTNVGTTATVTITDKTGGNYTVSGTKTFTITAKPLTGARVEVTGTFTYTGNALTPAPTVTLDGKTLTENTDYTVAYDKNTDAGTATITVTGKGNYSGTAQGTFTIGRATLTVDGTGTASGTYGDKLSELAVSGLTAKLGETQVAGIWKLTGDTVPNVGDSGEYTATFTPATGAGNYNALTAKVTLNIAQATAPAPQTGMLNVQNGYAREYTYDLNRLLPVLTSGQSFGGEVTYTLKTVNITVAGYYDSDTAAISGTTLTLPVKAVTSSDEGQIGTITVTISSKNFADVDATINVKRVNKQPVSIEGVTAQNGTYNGGTHNGYTGTPTASPYSGGFTTTYAKADGTALSGPPTNAGDYTVTFSLNPNDTYTGSRTLSFTISKASITIKADDKRADVGAAKPALTYTVTGLVSGDTLATAPTLACDADMNTIGQYPITASGAAVPSGGNYNTTITYVAGTLNVTDPTISVTGVTLNKTSTTLTVGGSERLTATVAPSDATDKSVTWASSNTAVATVDANGTVTAVSAGTATITVTTADGAKTATCTVTVRTNSSGGGSYVPSGPGSSTITVPVSGDKSTVHVSASVSGTTATVSKIDTSQIENVIGDNGQASMVEIDFTGLGKIIDTVKLPAAAIKDIAAKAQNEEVRGLTVKLPEAEISFDAKALSAIQAQAGSQITLTVTPAKPADLNSRQKEAVGSAPVFDLTLRSSSGAITDFRGGYATVSLPYTLAAGQNPSGVVVYYLDSTGNITPCTTMYDVGRKSAIFTTGHLSLYFVGYDPTAVWVNPFSDVAEGAWYYDAVRYASENGLMGGYGNGKFGPNDTLTRAQFAQILFNKEGRPVVNYLLQYGDVATSAWYTEAVRWATSQGIVSGYGNGMFGPNDNITREQLAVMLWRYAGSPAATEKELHFTDADKASGYALEALRWAVENGVMGGYGNGQLAPQGLATRAQVAQMLMNFLKNR